MSCDDATLNRALSLAVLCVDGGTQAWAPGERELTMARALIYLDAQRRSTVSESTPIIQRDDKNYDGSHDDLCERSGVDIGVGEIHSPCSCMERWYEREVHGLHAEIDRLTTPSSAGTTTSGVAQWPLTQQAARAFVGEWLWQEKWTGRLTGGMSWTREYTEDAARMCVDFAKNHDLAPSSATLPLGYIIVAIESLRCDGMKSEFFKGVNDGLERALDVLRAFKNTTKNAPDRENDRG